MHEQQRRAACGARARSKLVMVVMRCCVALALGSELAANASTPVTGAGDTAGGPTITVDEAFASWGLSCATAQGPDGKPLERCMVSQWVTTEPKGGKVLLGVTVDYADSPTVPTMRFRFAPVAKQSAGVGIKIDNQPEMRLAINDCNTQRCEAVGRLAPKVLLMWQKGRIAQFAFVEQGGKQVIFPITLSGFEPALSDLRRRLKVKK